MLETTLILIVIRATIGTMNMLDIASDRAPPPLLGLEIGNARAHPPHPDCPINILDTGSQEKMK